MIATILPSSTTFHAVDYNERKVSEGVAELLEMKNFGSIGKIDPQNREWEVGHNTRYDEIDDERQLKR